MSSANQSEVASLDSALPAQKRPLMGLVMGLVACLGILAIDMLVLEFARFQDWEGIALYLVFVVFIVQTALLGWVVGANVERQPIWWLYFGWMLVLVNLVLILVKLNSYAWDRYYQSAFVFAFLNAQIGLVLFWGILGSSDWRRRIPIAALLFLVSGYQFWFKNLGLRGWQTVATCYIVSVIVACVALRLWRFRLGANDQWTSAARGGRIDQFGIKHLFIWTTIVAVLFGIGRLVPWSFLASEFVDRSLISLSFRALLMTVIVVGTAWFVLGEKRGVWLRFLVFLGVLLAVGVGLTFVELQQLSRSRWSSLVGWRLQKTDLLQIWLIWTTLNGCFLAGLMLVIRMSGGRLARIKKGGSKSKTWSATS